MKGKLLLLLNICMLNSVVAQKELWGLRTGNDAINSYGTIFKTDFNGANITTVYNFDGENGQRPKGRLLLASNGKLYGTVFKGGYMFPETTESGGVLFEYDLIFNQYTVLVEFGGPEIPFMANPESGLIEPTPGLLYGTTSFGGIYKYTIATGQISQVGTVPNIDGSIPNPMRGELVIASNGSIYGATQNYSSCPVGMPFLGSIVRYTPANNNFSFVFPFNCTPNDGKAPSGSFIEAVPGKLYGTTWLGGTLTGGNTPADDGVLFEYDINSNTYTKKISFDHLSSGSYPGPLTLGDNSKLYGVLSAGGVDPLNPEQTIKGTIFEYDIITNTVSVRHYFKMVGNDYPNGHTPLQNTLLKSSDGLLYGVSTKGIFRFDPNNLDMESNVVTSGASLEYGNLYGDLIEICRKPFYTLIEEDTYTLCEGESFTHDLENSNAVSYIWKRNNQALASQTTGVLNLTNLQVIDSGDYSCEMVNECGTTITMPIHLTVDSCTGLDNAIGYKNAISLYPNPAQSIINIKLPENSNITVNNVQIINMLGQEINRNTNQTSGIDISNLSEGIYILKLSTQQGDWEGRFIKQ